MGVPRLQNYIQSYVRGGVRSVDIFEEIQKWKRSNAECIIVIDVLCLNGQFESDAKTALCGHRFWLLTAPLEHLFERLIEAGAELVFFLDGPVQSLKLDTWLQRRTQDYSNTTAITDALNAGSSVSSICSSRVGKYFRKCPDRFVLEKLCRSFGKVHESMDRECDLELAKYATDHNAIAVMAQDTDYLIFPGNWQYWSTRELIPATGLTIEFSRTALRSHLGLAAEQMGFFASLCGTDIIRVEKLARLHKLFDKPIFLSVAELTRKYFSDAQEKFIELAVANDFDEKMFRQSVLSYDIAYPDENAGQSRLWQEAFGSTTVLAYLSPYIQSISFCAFDHRHKRLMNIQQLFVPLFARQLGVVHNGQSGVYRPLRTRLSHDNEYTLLRVDAVCPTFAIPSMKVLQLGGKSKKLVAERYRLLCWMVTGNKTVGDLLVAKLNAMPKEYMVILLTLYYLTKMGQFRVSESNIVLAVEFDVFNKRVPRHLPIPEHICTENLLTVKLYTNMFGHILKSLALCGIVMEKVDNLRFDGVYFHHLRAKLSGSAVADLDEGRNGFADLRNFYV